MNTVHRAQTIMIKKYSFLSTYMKNLIYAAKGTSREDEKKLQNNRGRFNV